MEVRKDRKQRLKKVKLEVTARQRLKKRVKSALHGRNRSRFLKHLRSDLTRSLLKLKNELSATKKS